MSSQVPSIGRIVRYQHFGTPGGEFPPKESAAMVTGVNDDGTISATVFTSDGGTHPHKRLEHDEVEKSGGTWHWPEQAGPGREWRGAADPHAEPAAGPIGGSGISLEATPRCCQEPQQ